MVITWLFDLPNDMPSDVRGKNVACPPGPQVSVHSGGSSADGPKGSWPPAIGEVFRGQCSDCLD